MVATSLKLFPGCDHWEAEPGARAPIKDLADMFAWLQAEADGKVAFEDPELLAKFFSGWIQLC